MQLALTTLVVRDYDDALAYFTGPLDFELREDSDLGSGKRWVVVAPRGSVGGLLLAKAADQRQHEVVGDQGGGRVMFFLHTDDFSRDHDRMRAAGVRFVEEPRREEFGTVAVFIDLYGNKWDLIEPRTKA